MNKFEQVSNDEHQMSVAGGRSSSEQVEQVPRSDVQGRGSSILEGRGSQGWGIPEGRG